MPLWGRSSPGREPRGRDGRPPMNDVTSILSAIEHGDPQAAEWLLPLVYDELRKLAARRLAREKPGQTLQATALVHDAYLRLVGAEDPDWNGRGHFFAAAAEAMRRILVNRARDKRRLKRGGERERVELEDLPIGQGDDALDLPDHNKALSESQKRGLILFGLQLNNDDEYKTDVVRGKAACTKC